MTRHCFGHHTGGAAVAHDVDHHLVFLKTQSQWGRPLMRTVVSLQQTIRERGSRARMAVTSLYRAWHAAASHPAHSR